MSKQPNRNLGPLESLRGIAALMIVVYHLVELMKIPAPPGTEFISTHFGLGVPLFFTLSGFVLSYGYSERLGSSREIYYFYAKRFFRIAPLYYLMLLLWCVTNAWSFDNYFSTETILLNLSFLFSLVPGSHEGIVWASWSIGVEMLFYLLFPVLTLLFFNSRLALLGWLLSLIVSANIYSTMEAAGLSSYAYMNIGQQLPFFLAGMAAFRIWQARDFFERRSISLLLVSFALASALFLLANEGAYIALWKLQFGRIEHNVWSVIFAALIIGASCGTAQMPSARPLRNLGKVSFSLYLIHPLIFLGLMKLGFPELVKALSLGPWPTFGLAFGGALAILWAASNLSYRLIEQPGQQLGKRIVGNAK